MCQAVGGGIQVRVVNLSNVAAQHNLGAIANAAHNGLDLMGAEILGLVNDHELVGNGATANVGQRLHDQFAGRHQLIQALLGALAVCVALPGGASGEQVPDVVKDRLHPHG